MKNNSWVKYAASVLPGLAASFFFFFGAIIVCVFVAIIMDFVTGIVKSLATGEKISSKAGYKGFWKKCALILALAFGIFLDAFIPIMLGVIALEIPFTMPIGTVVGCYIVINEAISIMENINTAAPSALPRWVKKMLEGAGKTIDNGGVSNESNDRDGG